MGRNCGDIALYAGLAGGAESIIVPEMEFNIDEICERAIRGRNRGKLHNLVILAEGVGNPFEIAKEMNKKTGIETKVTVLGYLQRGGTPTTMDRIMASEMGKRAVELLLENKSNRVLGIKCNNIIDMDISEALSMKKVFDVDMYNTASVLSI